MKLPYQQLSKHLQKQLANIYLIAGHEILLAEEACQAIRQKAFSSGYQEHQLFVVDNQFSWQSLKQAAYNLSLFDKRVILELRLGSNKINSEGREILREYCQNPAPDKLLLIRMDKLGQEAWLKTLDKTGIIIQVWPVSTQQMPYWIKQRLQTYKLTAEPMALQFLAEQVEGNLLAADQEIQKLHLRYKDGSLSLDKVMQSITSNKRLEIFHLIDSALLQKPKRVVCIWQTLKNNHTEITILLWLIMRELRLLAELSYQMGIQKKATATLLQQHKVHQQHQAALIRALSSHSLHTLHHLIRYAHKIDCLIKGKNQGNAWNEMLNLCLSLAGTPLF